MPLAGQAKTFEELTVVHNRQPSAEQALTTWLLNEKPDEAALFLENTEGIEIAKLLDSASIETNLGIMRRLTPSRGAQVILALSQTTRRKLLSTLSQNRVVALLGPLSSEERALCLDELDAALADELRDLLQYPPETAGSLMDSRAISFRPEATIRDVIKQLRRHHERRVQDVFVVESSGKLIGAVPLESIVLADNAAQISTLIESEPTSVMAVASRDEIIQTFETHRIASIPVVDIDQNLVGVLRQREILQAAKERATASAVTMVGASEQERALSSPWFAIRKRLPWLQINLLTAFLAAAVVGLFEQTIASVTALAVLLPVVAGQSGNTGAQALAVTMRGLALREVHTRQWMRIAIKEAIAGAGNGIAVAIVTSLAVYFWSDSIGLASVICVSMVISMTLAGLSGAVIPMALTSFGMDPAQSSSIVLTTVTDVVGFFSFLGIATLMMAYI